MSNYYQQHVFFCVNERDDGSQSCACYDAREARNYTKKRCKDLGIHGPAQVRVNFSGCLGRCSEGPVIVVYPDNVWYSYVDTEDIDEIIEEHLLNGRPVQRLMLEPLPSKDDD